MKNRIQIKATGQWVWYEAKYSWDKYYYSLDGGNTWSGSKTVAYRDAEKAGTLQIAQEPVKAN
jgi:hypothetical protein